MHRSQELGGRRRRPEPIADSTQITTALDAAADLYGAGRLEAAAEIYRRVEARDPDDIRAVYSLAVIDLGLGRFSDARRRLKSVLRRRGDHFAAMHNLGVVEQALGGWGAAAEAYKSALSMRPEATETAFSLAISLAVVGRTDEAIALYRAMAEDSAIRLRALTRLAILRASAITNQELTDLRAAVADGALTPEARVGLFFALGGVLEAREDPDAAWKAFAAGNTLKHGLLAKGNPADRPANVAREHQGSIDRIRNVFTPKFIAAHAGQGDNSTSPIFIVGMPRSGSSLVEQILASHPHVQGLGESGALWRTIEGRFPYPPSAPREANHFRMLARRYMDAQRARGWVSRMRLTDKTLENHLHVGMIHLMFPRAKILHVVRDPMDTGLACWRQLFTRGNETLYDLAEIGAEQRRYQTMMDHWRTVLPDRVVEISYEALVSEPENQIRRLVSQVCALPWAEACLRFHETRRPVGTASADQVRQPISAVSVDRWRQYETQLAPLAAALRVVASKV
jgi:tetratricopeptide (TPR) repeat protein